MSKGDLQKGKHYTKADRGITYPKNLVGHGIGTDGHEYLFITICNERGWKNELHNDGVVHEPADETPLVKYPAKYNNEHHGRHIMVRFTPTPTEYEYIGDEDYIIHYDGTRNKIVLQQPIQTCKGARHLFPSEHVLKRQGVFL